MESLRQLRGVAYPTNMSRWCCGHSRLSHHGRSKPMILESSLYVWSRIVHAHRQYAAKGAVTNRSRFEYMPKCKLSASWVNYRLLSGSTFASSSPSFVRCVESKVLGVSAYSIGLAWSLASPWLNSCLWCYFYSATILYPHRYRHPLLL